MKTYQWVCRSLRVWLPLTPVCVEDDSEELKNEGYMQLTAITPQTTRVSPKRTKADPLAVETEPAQQHKFIPSLLFHNAALMLAGRVITSLHLKKWLREGKPLGGRGGCHGEEGLSLCERFVGRVPLWQDSTINRKIEVLPTLTITSRPPWIFLPSGRIPDDYTWIAQSHDPTRSSSSLPGMPLGIPLETYTCGLCVNQNKSLAQVNYHIKIANLIICCA